MSMRIQDRHFHIAESTLCFGYGTILENKSGGNLVAEFEKILQRRLVSPQFASGKV